MIVNTPLHQSIALPPSEVVMKTVKAFNTGNLEKAMLCYADDVEYELIGLPSATGSACQGKESLRACFKELSAQHWQVEVEVLTAEADLVTTRTLIWSDLTRQLGVAPLAATDEYLVRDGRIQGVKRSIRPESAAKLRAALSHIQE